MLAYDFRLFCKAFPQKHVRPDFRVMIIDAHFPVQYSVAVRAIAIGFRLRRKQRGKKHRKAFPKNAEFPVPSPDVMKQRTPRQKRQIDFLRGIFRKRNRGMRRAERMALVRNGHAEKKSLLSPVQVLFQERLVFCGDMGENRMEKLPDPFHHSI